MRRDVTAFALTLLVVVLLVILLWARRQPRSETAEVARISTDVLSLLRERNLTALYGLCDTESVALREGLGSDVTLVFRGMGNAPDGVRFGLRECGEHSLEHDPDAHITRLTKDGAVYLSVLSKPTGTAPSVVMTFRKTPTGMVLYGLADTDDAVIKGKPAAVSGAE